MIGVAQTARSYIYTISPCTWAIMHLYPRANALGHKCYMCTRALRALEHILILCPLRAHKMLYGPACSGAMYIYEVRQSVVCFKVSRVEYAKKQNIISYET